MADPSLSAQVADLLGADVATDEVRARRLPLIDAVAAICPAQNLLAALDEGSEVVLALLEDGSKVVLPDRCPHDGGLLSDGFVDGNQIVCARHGWEFDGHTGHCSHRSGLRLPCKTIASDAKLPDS